MRRLPLYVWPAVLAVAFGAWTWPQVAWRIGAQPTTLVARRIRPGGPRRSAVASAWRITDASAVRMLYADVETLPTAPPGPYACPADIGATWVLRFLRGGRTFLTARLDATGCGNAVLSPARQPARWTATGDGPAFWRDLGYGLHLSPPAVRGVPGG